MTNVPTSSELEARIDELLTRGVGSFVDPDGSFRKKLIAKASGQYPGDLIIKFGVDPTRPDIHLGHAVVLRHLRQFQDLGCKVVFLIGDFTTQIGDPTGKNKARPEIEQAQIEANMRTYLEQVDKILRLDPEVFSWIRNSDWFYTVSDIAPNPETQVTMTLSKDGVDTSFTVPQGTLPWKAEVFRTTRMQISHLHRQEIVDITLRGLLYTLRHITHSRLIERDMFQDRIKNHTELYMHEMMYPVLQGIDSYAISLIYGSCDLEVGGTDQMFNMLMGRDIMKANNMKSLQAVLGFELLVGLDGKEKMSKSLNNYISVIDSSDEMFGKVMSIPDAVIPTYFSLCTYLDSASVMRMVKDMKSGTLHPKAAKVELGRQIVEIYHGTESAQKAVTQFESTFREGQIPRDIPQVTCATATPLVDVLLEAHVVPSKTEFRRLLSQGAIRDKDDVKLTDPAQVVTTPLVLRIGKHRFLSIDVV